MTVFNLIILQMKSKLLNTMLSVLILSFGIFSILITFFSYNFIIKKIDEGGKNIDAVVSGKGSDLQIVLSSVWHADIPTGNIPAKTFLQLKKNKKLKKVVPISLGDSYKSYRVVGTNYDFLSLYNAKIKNGKIWKNSFEAVIGYNVARNLNLKVGSTFLSSHGVYGGLTHQDKYTVSGILAKSDSVVNNLIITSLKTVWDVHSDDHNYKEDNYNSQNNGEINKKNVHDNHSHSHSHQNEYSSTKNIDNYTIDNIENKEITALLIKYKSRSVALSFLRSINKNTNLQAASPSYEVSKLLFKLKKPIKILSVFAMLIFFGSLVIFLIYLMQSVIKRKKDIALYKMIGAKYSKIFYLIVGGGMLKFLLSLVLAFGIAVFSLFFISNMISIDYDLLFFIELIDSKVILFVSILAVISFVFCFIPFIYAYKCQERELLK